MRFWILLAAGILAAAPAAAQQIDQCALAPAPGPLAPLIQKLTCRLQIEDNLRMASEENLIIAQADQKIAEVKAGRLSDQLNDSQKQITELKKQIDSAKKDLSTEGMSLHDRVKAAIAVLKGG